MYKNLVGESMPFRTPKRKKIVIIGGPKIGGKLLVFAEWPTASETSTRGGDSRSGIHSTFGRK